jgi:hypothetical protein
VIFTVITLCLDRIGVTGGTVDRLVSALDAALDRFSAGEQNLTAVVLSLGFAGDSGWYSRSAS